MVTSFLLAAAAALLNAQEPRPVEQDGHVRPNIILINTDDMGAADWSGGGSRFIQTPHLDQMAAEGVVLTDFYASANVCTPSRAALLTGRYAVRSGLARGVIYPHSDYGLPQSEITLPSILREAGYATQIVGKWHLGTVPDAHPLEHGFDEFFGVPYSNDMSPFPLISQREVIEEEADQTQLTARYTEAAIDFIARQAGREQPFFIYLAHTFPHIPLYASDAFLGQSQAGRYGDTILEIDWSLGQLRQTLADHGVAHSTLIIFTSDNGPWFEGEAGVRGRKGDTHDGAYRVPFVAHLEGLTPPGAVSRAMAMQIDLMPTLARLAGAAMPDDRPIDGRDITALLQGGQESPHEVLVFFDNDQIAAIRTQRWRLVLRTFYRNWLVPLEQFGAVHLFDLETHGDELFNVAEDYPDVVESLSARLETLRSELEGLPQRETPLNLPGDE
ncbi:sulfatase [Alkalicaulis satelles]|uniref:Sulfatase n=1 Tax=Alkalicaulis satelles TaxID=2609175 RepID=A0A5M6ZBX5_9PROT|nr:sulfatase [Alkalicaulis satelles]KAA5801650.1 sulfatase [Alkalicaulis satelles]